MINYAKDQASADTTLNEVKGFGVNAVAVQADMANINDIRRMFATAQAAIGKLDIVVVNALIPTATQGAGVNTTIEGQERMQKFIDEFMPMGRLATVEDVADACEYFAGPLSSFVSAQQVMLSGGGLT